MFMPTSILEASFVDVKIYPNPASNKLTLSVENLQASELAFELYNLSGALVLSKTVQLSANETQIELDVTKIPNGFYVYHVKASSGQNSGTIQIRK